MRQQDSLAASLWKIRRSLLDAPALAGVFMLCYVMLMPSLLTQVGICMVLSTEIHLISDCPK